MPDKTVWDDPARDYRQRYELPDQFVWDEADWARIQFDGYMSVVSGLLPAPPARILDVGCGPGLGAKRLASSGYDVTGVDYSARGIEFGRILAPEVTLLVGDVRLLDEMPQLHTSFDAAVHIEVMEHIPPEFHARVLTGIRQALRPGGTLVLSAPSPRLEPSRWDYKHFERHELIDVVTSAGFRVEACVNQCHVNLLASPRLWRLLSNRYYDMRYLRHRVRDLYLRRYNIAPTAASAGRFIIKALKPA
jgi:2-polyprenyl-3-methyl-5-hydroxy-6-metoxy-1,4-benzoquinol methylase